MATASVQLWLEQKHKKVRVYSGAGTGFSTAFDRTNIDTWLDASEVIAFEDWPTPRATADGDPLRSIADGEPGA